MKQRSYLPRNFFRRPEIRELVPDLKFLITFLMISCESFVGVWIPGGIGEDAGFDPAAVAGGLADLERRGIIARDASTGEIFVTSFFRDNTFKGLSRHHQAASGFRAIMSKALKERVIAAVAASPGCFLLPSFLRESDEINELPSK